MTLVILELFCNYSIIILRYFTELSGRFSTAPIGESARPECCVAGAQVEPTSLLFKDAVKTYTQSETG